jgi:hypothetical protein
LKDADPRLEEVRRYERFAQQAPARRIRDLAVKEIGSAMAAKDFPKVIAEAARFRGALPTEVNDPRAVRVADLEQFAGEMIRQTRRNAAYALLLKAGDPVARMDAAEQFLAVPTKSEPEPRWQPVRTEYMENFRTWLRQLKDADSPEAKDRIRRYQEITRLGAP